MVTLGVIYVMIWGYLQLTGQVEEPFIDRLKRIALLAIVLGVVVASVAVQHGDRRLLLPGACGSCCDCGRCSRPRLRQSMPSWTRAPVQPNCCSRRAISSEAISRISIAGAVVYVIVAITAIYTMFLLALSRVALSILLVLGPLFFSLLLFDSTRRFFESWLAQLCNYAFITILTVMLASLMLHVVGTAAQNAAALEGGIRIADAVRVCLAAGLTFLVMRQVMPMAAGLANGLALSSFGVTSALVGWALGTAYRKGKRGAGDFGRGLMDRETSRWDSHESQSRLLHAARRPAGSSRPNQIEGPLMIIRNTIALFLIASAVCSQECANRTVRCDGKLTPDQRARQARPRGRLA